MERVKDKDFFKNGKVYLIGIGGSGMSGLARILKQKGFEVSGSDSKETETTKNLRLSGIPVRIGQDFADFADADSIIYSSAIKPNHVELQAAREMGLKVFHRAEVLAALFNQAETAIGVLGTHGKTTTSAMLSHILSQLHVQPTCFVGSDMLNYQTNFMVGESNYWVSEIDESDGSHELYSPHYAVLTNLEPEHLDHYGDWQSLVNSFERFLSRFQKPGFLAYLGDDAFLRDMVLQSGLASVDFGFEPERAYSAQNIQLQAFSAEFDLMEAGFFITRIKLSVPGRHNIANALATISILLNLGFDLTEIVEALSAFKGTKRRMEVKGGTDRLLVLDDYAHHPTEIKAVLRALKEAGKYVRVVFQPHRYSRVKNLCKEFAHAFDDAAEVVLTDIYAAGETNADGVCVEQVYQEVIRAGHPQTQVVSRAQILSYLETHPMNEGVMLFMGAGDISEIAGKYAEKFSASTLK